MFGEIKVDLREKKRNGSHGDGQDGIDGALDGGNRRTHHDAAREVGRRCFKQVCPRPENDAPPEA